LLKRLVLGLWYEEDDEQQEEEEKHHEYEERVLQQTGLHGTTHIAHADQWSGEVGQHYTTECITHWWLSGCGHSLPL